MNISNLKYIESQTLKQWLQQGSTNLGNEFIIVDVRDSDYIGGHIKGSKHYASSSLFMTLPDLIKDTQPFQDVIFHCALSQERGPSAALKYLRSVTGKNVWVLRGGFNDWQYLYGDDESVTEGYVRDLWR